MELGKTYLNIREFLCSGKYKSNDIVIGEVRKYEWGGYDASMRFTQAGEEGGLTFYCNPDSDESVAECMYKIERTVEFLNKFKAAIKEASKGDKKK